MVALDVSLKSLVVSKKLIQPVLIQLVGCTLCSDNGGTGVTGCLSKVTSSMLKKLIQPVLIQLIRHGLFSDNGGTLSSHNGGTGSLSKVTSSKLKKNHSTSVNTVSRSYSSLK